MNDKALGIVCLTLIAIAAMVAMADAERVVGNIVSGLCGVMVGSRLGNLAVKRSGRKERKKKSEPTSRV